MMQFLRSRKTAQRQSSDLEARQRETLQFRANSNNSNGSNGSNHIHRSSSSSLKIPQEQQKRGIPKRTLSRRRRWRMILERSPSSASSSSLFSFNKRAKSHNSSSNSMMYNHSSRSLPYSINNNNSSPLEDSATHILMEDATLSYPTVDLTVSEQGLHRSSFFTSASSSLQLQPPQHGNQNPRQPQRRRSTSRPFSINTTKDILQVAQLAHDNEATHQNTKPSVTSSSFTTKSSMTKSLSTSITTAATARSSTTTTMSTPLEETPIHTQQATPAPSHPYTLEPHQHDELGYLKFHYNSMRNVMAAWDDDPQDTNRSEHNKPIFWVQAEIPGDIDTGRDLFSHPLLVEAAESLFTTVLDINHPHCRARTPSGKTCCTYVSILVPTTTANTTADDIRTTPTSFASDDGNNDSRDDEHDNDRDFGFEQTHVPIVPKELTLSGLLTAMFQALHIQHSKNTPTASIPRYMTLLVEEECGYDTLVSTVKSSNNDVVHTSRGSRRRRPQVVRFGVSCPVQAEVDFAGLPGVVSTRLGSLGDTQRANVIDVEFDGQSVSYCALVRYGLFQKLVTSIHYQSNDERVSAQMEVARVQHHNAQAGGAEIRKWVKEELWKPAYDPKHALRCTPLRFVPLTPLQATRANRLIHHGSFDEAIQLLSPRQGQVLMKAMRTTTRKLLHEVVDVEVLLAWRSVCSSRHPQVLLWEEEVEAAEEEDDTECIQDTYNLSLHYERRTSMHLPRYE